MVAGIVGGHVMLLFSVAFLRTQSTVVFATDSATNSARRLSRSTILIDMSGASRSSCSKK